MSVPSVEDADASALRAAAAAGDHEAGVRYAEVLLGRSPGDVDAALPFLEPAALAGDAFAARTLAIAMRDRGRHGAAERWYRAAADADGGCAFGLATLLEKSGDLDGAAEWYARGAALGVLACRTNGAVLAARRGRPGGASAVLEEAAREGDHVAADLLERADALRTRLINLADDIASVEEEDEDEVQDVLDTLGEAREHTDVHHLFPDLLAQTVRLHDEAATATGSAEPLISRAFLLDDLGRWDDARRSLEEAAARFPDQPRPPHVLGLMMREHGEPGAAEAWLRRAAEAGYAAAQWSLAILLLKLRRLDDAEHWYRAYGEQAADLDEPRDVAAGLALVEAARREGAAAGERDETRLAALRAAASGGDAAAGRALGEILLDCGAEPVAVLPLLLPAAGESYARARSAAEDDRDADDVDLVERVGGLYLRGKDEFHAERWLRRAARLGHGRAAWWAGDRSDEYGDGQEAERMWALATVRGEPWCGWLAGRAMVRRGAHAEAEPLLRAAYAAREDRPPLNEAAYWLGRSLRGQGDAQGAAGWLRTAVRMHPIVQRGYTGFKRASLFDPRVELAEVLLDLDEDGEAGDLVAGILLDSPAHLVAHGLAARLAERRGDLDAARSHLGRAGGAPEGTGVAAPELRRISDAAHPH